MESFLAADCAITIGRLKIFFLGESLNFINNKKKIMLLANCLHINVRIEYGRLYQIPSIYLIVYGFYSPH